MKVILGIIAVTFAILILKSLFSGINQQSTNLSQNSNSVPYVPQITAAECYKAGSNERMQLCLNLAWQEQVKAMATMPQFPSLYQLQLVDVQMQGNSYWQPNPTVQGTLRNNSNLFAKNVWAQIKFFKNQVENCNSPADDTQYIYLSSGITPGDAQRFNLVVFTPLDTSGRFNWCSTIVGANE